MKEKTINKKTYLAGLLGEVMEWYDFTVYGFFALVIAAQFFPSDNHYVSVMSAFAAFALGFLMRPIGAIVFGYIGDNYGRKRVLTYSIFLMAIPSVMIGLMPTYETIGIFAPILLILMRMLQGLSVGGEHTGSIIYLSELSSHKNRALSAVVPFAGTILGVLLGSLMGVTIYSLFGNESVAEWAWRIPFLFGVLIAIVGIYIRKHLPETYSADDKAQSRGTFKKNIKENIKPFIQVFLLNLSFAVSFYTVFIYNPIWMQKILHTTKTYSLEINSIALLVTIVAMVITSQLSNRLGRKTILVFAIGGLTFLSYPLYKLMLGDSLVDLLMAQSIFAIFIGSLMGVIGVVMVELFKTEIRFSAVSIAFNLSFAIFGGTVPIIATWLIHSTHDNLAIAWYITIMSAISLITVFTIPETNKRENLENI
ncbi:MAG: MFS transporter [Helicobacteraceae bacterium]|nr:MFS transporter [Helicobacteraceae bacterium]